MFIIRTSPCLFVVLGNARTFSKPTSRTIGCPSKSTSAPELSCSRTSIIFLLLHDLRNTPSVDGPVFLSNTRSFCLRGRGCALLTLTKADKTDMTSDRFVILLTRMGLGSDPSSGHILLRDFPNSFLESDRLVLLTKLDPLRHLLLIRFHPFSVSNKEIWSIYILYSSCWTISLFYRSKMSSISFICRLLYLTHCSFKSYWPLSLIYCMYHVYHWLVFAYSLAIHFLGEVGLEPLPLNPTFSKINHNHWSERGFMQCSVSLIGWLSIQVYLEVVHFVSFDSLIKL